MKRTRMLKEKKRRGDKGRGSSLGKSAAGEKREKTEEEGGDGRWEGHEKREMKEKGESGQKRRGNPRHGEEGRGMWKEKRRKRCDRKTRRREREQDQKIEMNRKAHNGRKKGVNMR